MKRHPALLTCLTLLFAGILCYQLLRQPVQPAEEIAPATEQLAQEHLQTAQPQQSTSPKNEDTRAFAADSQSAMLTAEQEADRQERRAAAYGSPERPRTLADIPESSFRDDLLALSPSGRARALDSFNRMNVPIQDVQSLRIMN